MTDRKGIPLSPENKIRMETLAKTAHNAITEMALIVGTTLGKPDATSSTSTGISLKRKKSSAPENGAPKEREVEELHGIWEVCDENAGCGCYDYDIGLCYPKPCE